MIDSAHSASNTSASPETSDDGRTLEFTGSVLIDTRAERLWPKLVDPEFLTECIPGAERFEPLSDRRFGFEVKRGVNKLKIALEGDMEIVEMNEPEWLLIEGRAYDSRTHSEFEGVAAMELTGDHSPPVEMHHKAQMTFTGATSVLTPHLLRRIVEADVERFFDNIAENVGSSPPIDTNDSGID